MQNCLLTLGTILFYPKLKMLKCNLFYSQTLLPKSIFNKKVKKFRRKCRRRPAEALDQYCPGLLFRFNRPSRLHPSGSCVGSSEKLMNFMHFHNSSTPNCDHHILLIMNGNAHKESCHKLWLIRVREKGLYIIKTDCSGKIVVAFTIKEKNYSMVSLFCQSVLPFHIYICCVKFLIWLRYWSCFRHSDKSGYCSLSIFSFTNCYGHVFLFFFLKLGVLLQ